MPTYTLETIRIGPRNVLAGSDALYDAFYKIKNNFAILANANFSSSLQSGNGISLNTNPSTGVVTITNTGVIGLVAGNGISVSGSTGTITISATGVGSVTSVGVLSSSLSVTSSPITSSGNIIIEMPSYGVAGNYTAPTMTVDTFGRVIAIANGNISGSNIVANTVTANNQVIIGDTAIGWASITTTSTSAATIATIPVANYSGFKFFVKAHDTVGGNRFVATIDTLTDGSNVEVDEYGGMSFGADAGDVYVDIAGGNILLMTVPSSANSTTWTTQYTMI
jgi:hypothetical protein